jgi:hypothetical protein
MDIEHLLDKENIISGDAIYSEDAVNFCMEIPGISLFAGSCIKRLFNTTLGNILASDYLHCDIELDGGSIIVHKEIEEDGIIKTKGKASVSDMSLVNDAVLIHTGINIKSGKRAPATAFSTNLSDEEAIIFMHKGIEYFYGLLQDIFIDTARVV